MTIYRTKTASGDGIRIDLDGDEVARAIAAWIVGQGVHCGGPRTITVNRELIERGCIYVDPSGFVITPEGLRITGSDCKLP